MEIELSLVKVLQIVSDVGTVNDRSKRGSFSFAVRMKRNKELETEG
jgi:hypothetical protein